MRKPRTVVVILVTVVLLVIAAACGRDEASLETAGLSPLAPPGLVTPAPQVPTAEPGDTPGGQAVRQEVDRNDSPTPALTHGSPPPPAASGSPLHGSPGPSLKFGDVSYRYSGSAELPSGESADFVINGTEIGMDDLERVGTTNEGNTHGIQEGLVVYRLKDDGTDDVYTFRPGEDHVNPEDGQIFKGQDVWILWTTQ